MTPPPPRTTQQPQKTIGFGWNFFGEIQICCGVQFIMGSHDPPLSLCGLRAPILSWATTPHNLPSLAGVKSNIDQGRIDGEKESRKSSRSSSFFYLKL